MSDRVKTRGAPVFEVDASEGERFEQTYMFIVKLRMDSGVWEAQHEAATEDEARQYIAQQALKFPTIPPDDWGVFMGELTRIEMRIG